MHSRIRFDTSGRNHLYTKLESALAIMSIGLLKRCPNKTCPMPDRCFIGRSEDLEKISDWIAKLEKKHG